MSKTIMVVDDSPFVSKQIKDIVEDNGYEVTGYASYSGYNYARLEWSGDCRNP